MNHVEERFQSWRSPANLTSYYRLNILSVATAKLFVADENAAEVGEFGLWMLD